MFNNYISLKIKSKICENWIFIHSEQYNIQLCRIPCPAFILMNDFSKYVGFSPFKKEAFFVIEIIWLPAGAV